MGKVKIILPTVFLLIRLPHFSCEKVDKTLLILALDYHKVWLMAQICPMNVISKTRELQCPKTRLEEI